jgi:hypothetical protein
MVTVMSCVSFVLVPAQRRTGETYLNENSSRSHQILKLVSMPLGCRALVDLYESRYCICSAFMTCLIILSDY